MQTVKFSEFLNHKVDLIKLSPKEHAFATSHKRQLSIWGTNSLEVIRTFICMHFIDLIEWSPDSELICCTSIRNHVVQVFSLNDISWNCKIDEGALGIVDVCWSPDSRHILITSEFHVKITVWSLVSKNSSIIPQPKELKPALVFSTSGKYLIVGERREFKDYISLYTCDTWEQIKNMSVDTKDMSQISFSPNGFIIGVLENIVEGYKILFYSLAGNLLGSYTIDSCDFGAKFLLWSNNKKHITIGDCYEKIKLLNIWSFELIMSHGHPQSIESEDVIVYKLTENYAVMNAQLINSRPSLWEKYEKVTRRPVSVPVMTDKANDPKINPFRRGVQKLQLSNDGRYLASVNASMPKVVWIFDLENLILLHVLIHINEVKYISWHPEKHILAICPGSRTFGLWTPTCCAAIKLPLEDQVKLISLTWCSKKDFLILNSSRGTSSLLSIPQIS